jgi:hypothetical protein
MAWLLDTNILSELRRPKPEQRVVAFVAGCPLDQLYSSAVTLAEIRFGIELVGEPNRRADLNDWLAGSGNCRSGVAWSLHSASATNTVIFGGRVGSLRAGVGSLLPENSVCSSTALLWAPPLNPTKGQILSNFTK